MPEKSNGDYYYVESETINDLLDGFQIYDDGSGNVVFYDEANDEEYKILAGTGYDTPSGVGCSVNGTQVLSAQKTLDDNTGGIADDALEAVGNTSSADESAAINNNFKEIYDVLAEHGLTSPSS